jgi:membrane protease YdiL (CAAX protease family)
MSLSVPSGGTHAPTIAPLLVCEGAIESKPMSAPVVELPSALQARPLPNPFAPRERWIDIALIVAVCVLPVMLTSTAYYFHPAEHIASSLSLASGILREITGLALLAFILYRRNQNFKSFGLTASRKNFFIGIALWIVSIAASGLAFDILNAIVVVHSGHPMPRVNVPQLLGINLGLGWLLYSLINPWFEELIVRGFLMSELATLANPWTAIAVSTLLQTSYHLYQGWGHVLPIAVMFLCFSIFYSRTRSLMPIVVAHTCSDLFPLLLLAIRAHAR